MISNSTDRFNGVLSTLAIKAPCLVVALVNITLNGSQTVNGVAVVTGDRVLVIAQTNAVDNGIYDVGSSDWTRAADWDGNRDATVRSLVLVGTTDAAVNIMYQCDTTGLIVIGSTPVNFSIFILGAVGGVADLQAVTEAGNETVEGIEIAGGSMLSIINAIADAQLDIDVDNSGGPVNITANVKIIMTGAPDLEFEFDIAGDVQFNPGGNNALLIENNIVRVNTDSGGYLEIRDDLGSNVRLTMTTAGLNFIADTSGADPDRYLFQPVSGGEGLSFMIFERAAARGDLAGYGQLWIKDTDPNELWFTDDDGIDIPTDPTVSLLNEQNGDYTLVLADRGKTIHKASGGPGETYTIPANSSVAYPLGTLIAFQNEGGDDLDIAITSDTLTGRDGMTGTRTLGDDETAVIQKMTATSWKYVASDL